MIQIFLRSLAFHIYFFAVTTYLSLSYINKVIKNSEYAKEFYKKWAYHTAWGLKYICHIDLAIRGAEYIPQKGQFGLFSSKHQSTLETLILFLFIDSPAVILKKELENIPLAKYFIRGAGHIPIDRKGGHKTRQHIIDEAQERFENHQSILIYPEGTRSDINASPRYKRGIFAIYDHLKVECIPIALNTGLFWPKKGFMLHPGTAIIEFLPAISANMSEVDFMTELTTRTESTVARLIQEGVAEQAAIQRGTHPKYASR